MTSLTINHISMSLLGKYGRFGNQLFQYAFLRTYATRARLVAVAVPLTVQTAAWVGEDLFGFPPAPVTVPLPPYEEKTVGGSIYQPIPPDDTEVDGHDFRGYAQYHTSYYRPYKQFIRQLYQPVPTLRHQLQPALDKLQRLGRTRVGLHLRRGDYGRIIHYITPVQWYLDWLHEHWHTLEDPVLFIATEDRSLAEDFSDFDPVLAEDLGVNLQKDPLPAYTYLDFDMVAREPHQMDFYPDFWLLQNCEILVTPNSTFSFMAGMLNPHLQQFYRSHLPTQTFEQLDPWDADPLTKDLAEDYPDVPGIAVQANPYW